MALMTSLADPKLIARQTARMMIEIDAIHFNAEAPYQFTSGLKSPVYVDCRKIISYPRLRMALMDFAASKIVSEVGAESIDCVAGGETAGIPFAAWVADRLMLPMQYVRKKPKGFGRDVRIEGAIVPGQRTLLVEDLATDGGSKVGFCEALRQAGSTVEHCFVIFYYDIFKDDTFEKLGVKLHYLATWWDALDYARDSGHLDAGQLREVEAFLHDPEGWSDAHGGASRGATPIKR